MSSSPTRQPSRRRANSEGNPLESTGQHSIFTPHHVRTDERGVVSFVNPDFLRFTGFSLQEFLGRKCDILQGDGTDPDDVSQLSRAVSSGRPTSVVILNYTKGGSPFWNILRISPEVEGSSLIYTGDIISLPVPMHLRDSPKLCFDDALALMRVFSSVPRSVDAPLQFLRTLDITQSQRLLALPSVLLDLPPNGRQEERSASAGIGVNGSSSAGGNGGGGADSHRSAAANTSVNGSATKEQRHQNYGARFPGAGAADGVEAVEENGLAAANPPKVRRPLDFIAETSLPTDKGRFRVRAYRDPVTGAEPLAIMVGEVEDCAAASGWTHVMCNLKLWPGVSCRVHDQCVTSEVFGSLRCDCKQQLNHALKYMQNESIGLANKVAAYALQESGLDTVDANRHLGLRVPDDARSYESVYDILVTDLGIRSVKLLTNNPRKIACLRALGIDVVERVPCVCVPTSKFSQDYVRAKVERMGHIIDPSKLSQKVFE